MTEQTKAHIFHEINERGLAEIREILSANAKAWQGMNPGDIPAETVYAYAEDAERGMQCNSDARFEIRGLHSVSGNPMTFSISDEGVDVIKLDG